jgi:hypothetical protein
MAFLPQLRYIIEMLGLYINSLPATEAYNDT